MQIKQEIKEVPCVTCLGVLQDYCEKSFAEEVCMPKVDPFIFSQLLLTDIMYILIYRYTIILFSPYMSIKITIYAYLFRLPLSYER